MHYGYGLHVPFEETPQAARELLLHMEGATDDDIFYYVDRPRDDDVQIFNAHGEPCDAGLPRTSASGFPIGELEEAVQIEILIPLRTIVDLIRVGLWDRHPTRECWRLLDREGIQLSDLAYRTTSVYNVGFTLL